MRRIFTKYGKKDLDSDIEADMIPAEMVDLVEAQAWRGLQPMEMCDDPDITPEMKAESAIMTANYQASARVQLEELQSALAARGRKTSFLEKLLTCEVVEVTTPEGGGPTTVKFGSILKSKGGPRL